MPQLFVFATPEAHVMLREARRSPEPQLFEQVPQFTGVSQRAALMIGEIDDVAAQRLLGDIGELFEPADGWVPSVVLSPCRQLVVERKVAGMHASVGGVAQGANEHSAERMQVRPGED